MSLNYDANNPYFQDLKDLYVNNTCSYLADTNKILYIGVNYSIKESKWIKDSNNIHYYQIRSLQVSTNTTESKLYKYLIAGYEDTFIVFGLRELHKENEIDFSIQIDEH